MKNILVVKMSSIGDVIHALPVSYAIKETYPDAHLTWVVEPPAYDIVAMDSCIDEIIVFHKKEFRHFGGFLKNFGPLRRKIQERDYDVVLDLQGLFKSAAVASLAKAPKGMKFGMWNMREGSKYVSKPVVGEHVHDHVIERYLDTARAIGCKVKDVRLPLTVPEKEQRLTRQIFAQAGANMENPYVVCVVGASWPTKCWPDGHFAALGDWLYDKKIIPVLVGSGPVESQKAAEIMAKMDIPPINLVGKLNFKQLAYLFQQAAAVVGGDTGPTHLAVGLKTPTIMLMGPTYPRRTGPYGQMDNLLVVDRDCRECMKRACPLGHDCMAIIQPEAVEAKLCKLLSLDTANI
ncbi:lipopolysaccharide heptosyltransferase I [Mitsuokella sp.]|uniref:lipopolysaccharide heptosyltransferase I n=1 Tax=unclassified Mitsuokella TaxID=2637239 RepID=UPI003D7E42CD